MDFSTLNEQQEKAVKSLERALKKCREANISFANLYGSLEAFDGNVVKNPGAVGFDITDYPLINNNHGRHVTQHGYDFDSFADDEILHYVQVKE